ncbi:MAG: P22 phage major capsid protein family protein [Thalassolituus sp.]
MANDVLQDKMTTLFEQVLDGTENKMQLTKSLQTFDMSDLEGQRSDDTMYIPQEIMVDGGEGIETDDSDVEDIIQRVVPVSRTKAVHAVVDITTKQLRDEMFMAKTVAAMSRTLANRADRYAYGQMHTGASMVSTSAGEISINDITAIDNKFDMRGYSAYERKAFYSPTDYESLTDAFAGKTYSDKRTTDAIERSMLQPIVGRFESYKADYNVSFAAASVTTGITVTANTSHTPSTYTDSSETVYKDNRVGTIALSGLTPGDLKVGDKFTIAGVNALNEEPGIKEDTGQLQEFTIRTIETDGSVYGISPQIVITGPYRNCTDQAAAAADVTILNTANSQPSMFFLPESTVIIPGNLPATDDGITVAQATTANGLPMRLTKQYYQGSEKLRLKMLLYFDVSVVQPQMINLHLSGQS